MELEKYVNCKVDEINELIENLNRKIRKLPEGRISIRKRRSTYSLSISSGGKKTNSKLSEKYLSLSHPDAQLYATKLYLEKLKLSLEKESKALTAFLQNYQPANKFNVISAFPDEVRRLISNPLLHPSEASLMWENSDYETNNMPFDEKNIYCSIKGYRVRSRAELIIANMLYELQIPHRYEMAYSYDGYTYYPDFTLMNPFTEELYYLEYFGLMDNEDYRQKTFTKIRNYSKTPDAGRFIFIFESESIALDTIAIQNTILTRMGLSGSERRMH